MTETPANQAQYQVRFDWGLAGANRIAPGAHVVVWLDVLSLNPADPLEIAHDGALLSAGNAAGTAIADWVLQRQAELGDRAYVAVVAAGGPDGRFTVEDLLAAGAVVDALADAGIDFCSPEAASAAGAFQVLRNATSHLLTASVTGQELIAAGSGDVIDAARASAGTFTVLRD